MKTLDQTVAATSGKHAASTRETPAGTGMTWPTGTTTRAIDEKIKKDVESQTTAESWTKAAMKLEPEIIKETWGVIPLYNGPWIVTAKKGLSNLTPEPYVGLDGFGVQPVENVGWEK